MKKSKKILALFTALSLSTTAFAGLTIPASADETDAVPGVELMEDANPIETTEPATETTEAPATETTEAPATEAYYTMDFENETARGTDNNKTGDKQEDNLTLADNTYWESKYGAGGMSIAQDSNSDINMFFKYAIGSTSGSRATSYALSDAAKTLDDNQRSVLEMDFYMNTAAEQIVITGSDTTSYKSKSNNAYTGTYAVALYQTDASTFALNTVTGTDAPASSTGYSAGTWAHLKAVMNFKEDTVVASVTSLDGETTYLAETKIPMSGDLSGIGAIVIAEARYDSAGCGIDNVVFRPYADGDIAGTYYMATFVVDGKTSTKTADTTTGLIDGVPDTTKTGYLFMGWSTDGSTEYDSGKSYITSQTVLETKLTADITYTAVYQKDADYIEPLESLEFSSFPTDGLPTLGADENTAADNVISVKLVGELGNELTSDGAPTDSRVTDLDVKWEFDGFRTVVSKNTASTDDPSGNTYCDSYAEAVYDETDPTTVNFKLKSVPFNFYGQVKATVTYHGTTMTITKPMSVLPDKTTTTGVLLPKAGYISDFDLLEDTMVGYQATTSSDNKSATDIVTGDWAAYGGNSGRGLYIAEDESSGKFLKLKSTGTNSSSFAANNIGTAPTGQVIISQDVRFYNSGSTILYKSVNPVTWTSGEATTFSLDFTGSGFTFNGNTIDMSATTGVWYHIVLSADVTSKLCYAKIYDTEGNLLGESDTVSFSDAGSTSPIYLCYRTPDNASGELDFNDVKVYTPEISGDLTTTISSDTLIIPTSEVSEGINYNDGTVTVKKSDANDGDKAVLINASYDSDGTLASVNSYDLTFEGGLASQSVNASNGSKLMVWDSLNGMKPIAATPVTVESGTSSGTANTATLTVDAKSTEGYNIIGEAEWSVTDATTSEESTYVTITPDADNSHKATLAVAEGASSGTYNVTVSMGGKQKTIEVTVTGTQESVKFTKSTSSISIPLEDGVSDKYEYSAMVVDKNSNNLNREITYAMYDKNNENEFTNTDAISFDKTTGTLTVTSDAKATTVYIRATSTNTDGDTISRSLKVDIHGLAFDFGTTSTAEGYTAVTADTAYSDKTGYGISSGSATAGGEESTEDADADNLTGSFGFQAKVENNKIYTVTINYSGTLASEYINSDLSGVQRTNETKGAVTYQIPVIDEDGILDLSFTGATVSSIVIEKQADKTAGGKPNIYTVGDSTIANNGSWAYVMARDFSTYTDLPDIVTFTNNGRGGKNLSSYYTGGELIDRVLVNVKPGDYVMIGDMGTNGMGSSFEDDFNYYIDACEAMGAKVILNSYSPHGAVGDYASGYDSATNTFTSYRQDSYDQIVRGIYAERSDSSNEKYDANIVGFVDIGKMADAAFNAYVEDYASNDYESKDAAAQAIIKCFGDHNHYSNGTIAAELMIKGYGTGDNAKGIVKSLYEIISADLAE